MRAMETFWPMWQFAALWGCLLPTLKMTPCLGSDAAWSRLSCEAANQTPLVYSHYGNSYFAECRKICRVANHGHSAKRLFAECQTTHSANISLPSVCLSAKISTQQRAVLGKGWPGQTASVVVPFAECPAVRHSAKEPPLPSARWAGTRQSPLCRVPTLALGKM